MKIALTDIHAAASARSGMLAFVRTVVLGCAVACAAAPAFSQERDGRRNAPNQDAPPANREQPRAERMAPPPQPVPRAEPRPQFDRTFDARAEDQRRQVLQQEQGSRRGGRLTPDERRELRRQINEAGVDLYPNAPRR